ncbi:MAG: hypothetical protein JWP66_2077 [Naasia sp.]|nr:hypothetical protein [Naasia sp.]
MPRKEYNSRISRAPVYTTARGGRFVRPFDIIRSESGRAIIESHSKDTSSIPKEIAKTTSGNKSRND